MDGKNLLPKFSTEACLNVFAEKYFLFPVESLYTIEEPLKTYLNQSHVYMILSAPKYFFDCVKVDECGISFDIVDKQRERFFHVERMTVISQPINYKELEVRCEQHKMIISGFSQFLLNRNHKDEIIIDVDDVLKLLYEKDVTYEFDVLYVGQAQGREKNRGALERLESHKTLQKIVIECLNTTPDKRTYIMLFEFQECNVLLMNGIDKKFQADERIDKEHFDSLVEEVIDINLCPPENRMRQIVNITEAAIICYFKPIYNKMLVDNFPSPRHTSYKRYYDLEYNMVIIELNINNDYPNFVLKTDTNIIDSPWKFIEFELYKDDRPSMSDIFKRSKNTIKEE